MSTTVTVPETTSGISSATVFSYTPNAQSTMPQYDTPSAGYTYGVVDAQECAGPGGAGSGADAYDFSILLSNGSTASSPTYLTGVPTNLPSESELGSGNTALTQGQCDRGWVVFNIPDGVTATYVEFTGNTAGDNPNSTAKWTVAG
jgi:hypothetical protein